MYSIPEHLQNHLQLPYNQQEYDECCRVQKPLALWLWWWWCYLYVLSIRLKFPTDNKTIKNKYTWNTMRKKEEEIMQRERYNNEIEYIVLAYSCCSLFCKHTGSNPISTIYLKCNTSMFSADCSECIENIIICLKHKTHQKQKSRNRNLIRMKISCLIEWIWSTDGMKWNNRNETILPLLHSLFYLAVYFCTFVSSARDHVQNVRSLPPIGAMPPSHVHTNWCLPYFVFVICLYLLRCVSFSLSFLPLIIEH